MFFVEPKLSTTSTVTDNLICISDNDPDFDVKWWIKSLNLNEEDKTRLLGNEELTDNIVNAAQALLSAQFPHTGGFQNTLRVWRAAASSSLSTAATSSHWFHRHTLHTLTHCN